MPDRLYLRQLLSGRDYAVGDPIATQMVNFTYLIGDRVSGEAMIVDPAYAVGDLLDVLDADGMRLTGVLGTHYHADHVGGSMMGHRLEGISEVLDRVSVPIHVQRDEAEWVKRTTGVSDDLTLHDGGDVVTVGEVPIQLLHTPGHTPGSQCFLVEQMLISGDTLFLEGCGRTDLPGSDAALMYESLQKLAALPDDVAVYPGHKYAPASVGSMAMVREQNYVFRPKTREAWMTMFGAN